MLEARVTVPSTSPGDSRIRDSDPAIAALRPDIAVYIQSTITIISLTDVVIGLLRNSLDAGTSDISISLDLTRRACVVEDNGCGIPQESFRPEGGLCKPHHSSTSSSDSSFHARHGMFLASLSTLSLLSITSRHVDHITASSLLIHRGRILSRRVPCRNPDLTLATSHGTAVQVRDLFGNVPVRVKHHAQILASPTYLDKDWDHMLLRLAAEVLSWPSEVSVSIEDRENRSRRVRFSAQSTQTDIIPKAEAKVGRKSSLHSKIKRVGAIMSAFHLLPRTMLDSFVPASASSNNFTVKGIISTIPFPTSRLQFISFGPMPLYSSGESKELYDTMNHAFQDSAFGSPRDEEQQLVVRGPRVRDLRMGRKAVDRWPVFYLNIEPASTSEITRLSVDWAPLCRTLVALAHGWLRANGFQSGLNTKQSKTDNIAPRPLSAPALSGSMKYTGLKRLRSSEAGREAMPVLFSSWSRIKSSGANLEREVWRRTPSEIAIAHPSSSVYKEPGSLTTSPEEQTWLSKVLQSWQNPVFAIPAAENGVQAAHQLSTDPGHLSQNKANDLRLTKQGLAQAEVLAQIDRKYILVRVPFMEQNPDDGDSERTILVIIDQHAASERVIVERLFTGLDTEAPVKLSRPLHFQISSYECRLTQSISIALRSWGILLDVRRGKSVEDESQIIVTHLPPAIAERCMQEPRLLIELLREEIHGERAPRSTYKDDCKGCIHGSSDTASGWLGKMGHCPSGIVNMVNSRACRSAIMFNDPLSIIECRELVKGLSQCVFPFSCAHGRVSMVPLVMMDEVEPSSSSPPSIAADMKRWMNS